MNYLRRFLGALQQNVVEYLESTSHATSTGEQQPLALCFLYVTERLVPLRTQRSVLASEEENRFHCLFGYGTCSL